MFWECFKLILTVFIYNFLNSRSESAAALRKAMGCFESARIAAEKMAECEEGQQTLIPITNSVSFLDLDEILRLSLVIRFYLGFYFFVVYLRALLEFFVVYFTSTLLLSDFNLLLLHYYFSFLVVHARRSGGTSEIGRRHWYRLLRRDVCSTRRRFLQTKGGLCSWTVEFAASGHRREDTDSSGVDRSTPEEDPTVGSAAATATTIIFDDFWKG